MTAKKKAAGLDGRPEVRLRRFRSYSGPSIKGTVDIQVPGRKPAESDRVKFHVDRAYWLTTKVETGGKFGAIVMYDGTAMTAGPDQHIAVYPKELANEDGNPEDDQGSLWALLRRMETVRSSQSYFEAVQELWDMFAEEGWYVAMDGKLRYMADEGNSDAGDLVFGQDIRNVFTPLGGKVLGGPSPDLNQLRSKKWALAFHKLFAHPGGFTAQIEFGKEHLVHRSQRRRIKIPVVGNRRRDPILPRFRREKLEVVGYGNREITSLQVSDSWPEELDLALSVYQSHSVNAPAIANKALGRAAAKVPGGANVVPGKLTTRFAKWLIRFLGNNSYGRWDDDIKHGRYQRTRLAARASGLWPRRLFDGPKAIMPKDLRG